MCIFYYIYLDNKNKGIFMPEEKKAISDWSVTPLCRSNNVTKRTLYEAIMNGKLTGNREPGARSWTVTESDLVDFIENKKAK